jgi:hypothetical protein
VTVETQEQEEVIETPESAEDAQTEPKKRGAKGAQRPRKPLYFPRPPKFKCGPEQFFKYWRTLPEECLNRSMVYVYSVWPVMNPMQGLTPEELADIKLHKRKPPVSNIAKPDKPYDSDDWEGETLHRWGSGTLHFKLNDSGVSGNPQYAPKTICTCDVTLNHPDYPPVRDWRLLDMAIPSNQSLIVNLRAKNIPLPGDDVANIIAQEEDDLANVEAISKLTDALVQQTRDSATRNNQQPQAAAPDVQGLAGAKAVESVAEGAKQGFAIMSEAIKKANEVQAKAGDPKEYIKDLRDVALMMQPPPQPNNGNSDLMAMMKMQHETHLAETRAMNERLATAEARNQALLDKLISRPADEPAKRPKSLIEELKSLTEMKDVLREFIGGGDGDSDMPWYAKALMQGLDVLPGAISNVMHNIAVARAGQGVPQAPPVDADAAEEETPAAIAPPQPASPDAMIINALSTLKAPIIQALATASPGYDFAAALIYETKNEQLYSFLSGQGKEGLFAILQKHQELWAATRPYAARLEKFADEFLDVERVKSTLIALQAPKPPNGTGRTVIDPVTGQPIQTQGPRVVRPS